MNTTNSLDMGGQKMPKPNGSDLEGTTHVVQIWECLECKNVRVYGSGKHISKDLRRHGAIITCSKGCLGETKHRFKTYQITAWMNFVVPCSARGGI